MKEDRIALVLTDTAPPYDVQQTIEEFIKNLPDHGRVLIQELTTRALKGLQDQTADEIPRAECIDRTVSGKPFRYRGSIAEGLEIHFKNSQPLRITKASIDKIIKEIADDTNQTQALSHHLSYVVPLLQEQKLVNAFKEGRGVRRRWRTEAGTFLLT